MRAKGQKKTKSGRVFVTCTLSPEGFSKLRVIMEAIGATSQGQVIEQALHRWYAEEPLVKGLVQQNPANNVLKELQNRGKKCQEKTNSGKLSENI